jgi:WD40 repeat protein
VRSVAVRADGRWVAAGCLNGELHVWDAERPDAGRSFPRAHTALVSGVAFHPDGKVLGSCSWDGALTVWKGPPWDKVASYPLGTEPGRRCCASATVR